MDPELSTLAHVSLSFRDRSPRLGTAEGYSAEAELTSEPVPKSPVHALIRFINEIGVIFVLFT
jgi:hypothetical protein